MFTVRRLHRDDVKDIENAINVLDKAFGHKYFLTALADESLPRVMLRMHLMTAFLDDAAIVHVVENPEDGIMGVAIWFGPGGLWLNTERQRAEGGWYDFLDKVPESYRAWWSDYFISTYNAYCEQAFGGGVKLAGYHLQLLGVAPEHQRKGAASLLIKTVEKMAKSDGVCSLIETIAVSEEPGKNWKYYTSLGYNASAPGPFKTAADPETNIYFFGFKKTCDEL